MPSILAMFQNFWKSSSWPSCTRSLWYIG